MMANESVRLLIALGYVPLVCWITLVDVKSAARFGNVRAKHGTKNDGD
jgi:hypothetical protein